MWLAKRDLSTWVNLCYLEEEKHPFDLMIMLCEGDFPETTSTKNKFASNCSCWTLISMLWQYMERWISFTWNSTFCHSARDSGRTSPVHSRHSCNECYIGEIGHCATTSQKLLAHHDAAGTSELSDVAARSQGMNRCPGHASSANIIHWRVGASVRHLCSVYKFIWAEWECCVI